MIQYWPQLTYVALLVFSLGISLEQHGKPKTGNPSFCISTLDTAHPLWLLYQGGIFNVKGIV